MTTDHRLHALDAVRAGALLLGIVPHTCMSFFLPVPAMDVSQSTSLAVLFYVIHMFRMSLFFLLAGFFAHMSFHRKGARAFAGDRVKRIALPMLVGWLVMGPLLGVITLWGLRQTFGDLVTDAPPGPDMGLPLTHLWFLYYLCLFYVGFLALRWLLQRMTRLESVMDMAVSRLISGFYGPLLLGAPLALVLYNSPAWASWFGIPTPDFGLNPKLSALTGYGLAFTLGWWLHRQPSLLHTLQVKGIRYMAVAVLLTSVCLMLVGLVPGMTDPFASGPDITVPVWHKPLYILLYTSGIWFWVLGVLGTALRFLSAPSARWRYLADASYWMYIVHLPVVFVLQVLVARWPLHWSIKFPLILLVTTGLLLLSYHLLVRPTRLGHWLGSGRSKVINLKTAPV